MFLSHDSSDREFWSYMESTENKQDAVAGAQTSAMEKAPPERRTVWTPKQKLVRLIWGTLGKAIWICLPCARSVVLRLFGAKIGRGCTFFSER